MPRIGKQELVELVDGACRLGRREGALLALRGDGAAGFFVSGRPFPQGSKSAPVAGVVRDRKGLRPWREKVALSARAAGWRRELAGVAFEVGLVFTYSRPKCEHPPAPITRADIDKLERAILDALTHVCWANDNQVVEVKKQKAWAPGDGVAIFVRARPDVVYEVKPEASSLEDLAAMIGFRRTA